MHRPYATFPTLLAFRSLWCGAVMDPDTKTIVANITQDHQGRAFTTSGGERLGEVAFVVSGWHACQCRHSRTHYNARKLKKIVSALTLNLQASP